MTTLEKLGIDSIQTFLRDTWETRLHVHRGRGPAALQSIFSLDVFEHLLGAGNTGLSIVTDGMARPVTKSGADIRQIYSIVHDSYAAGASVLQTEIQDCWMPLAMFCRELTEQLILEGVTLTQAVHANAYLTPARSQAFNLHYDNHCAFILQIEGTKDWEIFNPETKLPTERCVSEMSSENLGSPCFSGSLTAGDVLYIPRGFPHVARATDKSSLHVTLSLKAQTWAQVIYSLCLKDANLRRSFRHSMAATEDSYGHFIDSIRPSMSNIDIRKYLEELDYRRNLLSDLEDSPGFAAIDDLAAPKSESIVARDANHRCEHSVKAGKVWLFCGGKALPFDLSTKPAIEYICQHTRFSAKHLPVFGDEDDALNLIRQLLLKGIVSYEHVPGFPRTHSTKPDSVAAEY